MNRKAILSAALCVAAALAVTPPLLAEGMIGTVERGEYQCELPAEVAGEVALPQPDESFTVASASRYRSPQGNGSYLRRGDRMTMTSGPRNGTQYQIVSDTMLRKLEGGEPGRLRCYRRGR